MMQIYLLWLCRFQIFHAATIDAHCQKVQFKFNGVKTVISAEVCKIDEINSPTKDKFSQMVADALCEMLKI